mmetsp:Transcript_23699/g.28937  ORF Transcript_23699/g.28937 Transcript_23699/m.28937 type:complete len:1516 (+) Transcript_23699:70-4617(+)|eukprot:CAMPEP_0172483562 /NCGR_PEP_ID=MMETSP1066-20121228/10544_1 /TAXON_ID=671091 /ORGANISM="Coscinodiscus wailesii, Strain CCMP2513" /LENGTH=1515 /DNA_ID=CAMNT_0013247477 /DNA_START=69 /DNA_END=4616 /DNA_ORIENTATION=+
MSEGRLRKITNPNQHNVKQSSSFDSPTLVQNIPADNANTAIYDKPIGNTTSNRNSAPSDDTLATSDPCIASLSVETKKPRSSVRHRKLNEGRYCQTLLDNTTDANYKQTLREISKLTNVLPAHQQHTLLEPLLLAAVRSTSSLQVKLAREVLPKLLDRVSYTLPSVICSALESLENSGCDCAALLKQFLSLLDKDRSLDIACGLLLGHLNLKNNASVRDVLANSITGEEYTKDVEQIEKIILSVESNKTASHHIPTLNINNLKQLDLPMSSSSQTSSLPLFSSLGEQITNVLSDLGPACTSNPQTLRDTISEVTNSLLLSSPDGSGGMNRQLDESSLARLLVFFAEKASHGGSEENGLSAELVSTLLPGRLSGGDKSRWNLDCVQRVLEDDYSHMDWSLIARRFDYEGFYISSLGHLEHLLKLYRAGARFLPPLSTLLGPWSNPQGQFTLLDKLLQAPPSLFTFDVSDAEKADAAIVGDRCANRGWACTSLLERLLRLSDMSSLARPVRDLFVKGLLTCPEVLLCSLVRLQLTDGAGGYGITMKGELMRELIPHFFKPRTHSPVRDASSALERLWRISPTTVGAACGEAWRSTMGETPLSRLATVLHIVGIIQILGDGSDGVIVNGAKDQEFSVAVAFVMADNQMLNLRAWLKERVASAGVIFVLALVRFLKAYYSVAQYRTPKSEALVTLENLRDALLCLQSVDRVMLSQTVPTGDGPPQPLADYVTALTDACLTKHEVLRNDLPRYSVPTPAPTPPPPPSSAADDIEEMANTYFQKIYTSESSVQEVVNMLKKFKMSGNAKENDIFACMIHNLFDEYRFFNKYPEKELRITGILFGTLIQEQLVTSITLGIALRYVLEALRKSPGKDTTSRDGKMFRFGMFALQQFKGRLHEWPQYCSHVVQIKHLKEGYEGLVKEIEGAMAESQIRGERDDTSNQQASVSQQQQQQEKQQHHQLENTSEEKGAENLQVPQQQTPLHPPNEILNGDRHQNLHPSQHTATPPLILSAPSALSLHKPVAVFGPKLGRAVNNIGEGPHHDSPPDRTLDQVCCLFNNVSPSNVEQKAKELRELLEPKYFGWLGHYLVVKRISSQPNFHSLYLAFLDQLGDFGRGLVEAILASVYLNVGNLLLSENITTSTHERSLLKNLGSWLGQTTLARNRPILQIMLDCKELLFQGYENGMLIAVTPFVAKILEGAKNSVVFRPPNPWLMGLLSVFRSLYNVDDLKMNIKFEVEVLCKNLGLTLDDIPIRNDDLTKRLPPVKEQNPDFTTKSSMVTPVPPAPASPKAESRSATPSAVPEGQTVIPNLAAYVTINPTLNLLFQTHNNINISSSSLKRSVPIAVDRAIREIIQPVVERSVTIAGITTKEIVTKDFAMEGDDQKMRKAAQLMVANLAGSLALVTCREPLRASVSTHLRQLLTSSNSNLSEQDSSAIEQCVAICATDNLELGCMLIEKAATEKAVRDMDETLAPALQARRNHKEQVLMKQTSQPYYDRAVLQGGRYPSALPEPLRPPLP